VAKRASKPEKSSSREAVGRKSKRKGGSAERKIAKALSLWFSLGQSDRVFQRTVRSGGWDARFAAGDLIAPVADFALQFEVRDRKVFKNADQLLSSSAFLARWWKEGEETLLPGKELWYVFKPHRGRWLLAVAQARLTAQRLEQASEKLSFLLQLRTPAVVVVDFEEALQVLNPFDYLHLSTKTGRVCLNDLVSLCVCASTARRRRRDRKGGGNAST